MFRIQKPFFKKKTHTDKILEVEELTSACEKRYKLLCCDWRLHYGYIYFEQKCIFIVFSSNNSLLKQTNQKKDLKLDQVGAGAPLCQSQRKKQRENKGYLVDGTQDSRFRHKVKWLVELSG